MRKVTKAAIVALTVLFGAGDIELGGQQFSVGFFTLISDAEARRGRPLTPVSGGCRYGTYHGYSLYSCGGVYYQKSGSSYVIVYF